MGFADDMDDLLMERQRAELLSRPSTHFVDAHGGKDATFLFEDGNTLRGTIGAASGPETIIFDYMDDTQSEWRDVPASMFANIERVFVDADTEADLTRALALPFNPAAEKAIEAAAAHGYVMPTAEA